MSLASALERCGLTTLRVVRDGDAFVTSLAREWDSEQDGTWA